MITYQEIIVRLLLAALLGSAVGIERERLEWVAGLRTHMLVSVGAAVFMIVSAFGFSDVLGHSNVMLDPSRVAAQVASGIGFLGAGTIILRKEIIHGLTTAASLWAVASIGLAVGGGLYMGAVATTVVVLIILVGIKPIERRLFANRRPRTLILKVARSKVSIPTIQSAIMGAGLQMRTILIESGDNPEQDALRITLNRTGTDGIIPLIETLRQLQGVASISHDDE